MILDIAYLIHILISDMPRTRACKKQTVTRQLRPRRSRSAPIRDDEENTIFLDDEETMKTGMTLCVKDEKLGYIGKKGFVFVTNFLVDIEAQVSSQRYSLKGILFLQE